jgi:hypothetical protein
MLRAATLNYLHTTESALSREELSMIDEAIADVQKHAEPRTIHRIFRLATTDGILTVDANIDLNFPDLQKHLRGCEECLFIAGTLGDSMDKRLKYVSHTDMTKYIMMDAAAGALIEETLDQLESSLPIERATFRYSPGYGDVPLSLQKQLLAVLDTHRRIGLTVTPHYLMVPTKSISGFVGIGSSRKERSCDGCKMIEKCEFRRNDTRCYQVK